jgi:hypothetical protein
MRGGILILLLFLLAAFTLGVVVANRGPSPQYRAALEAQQLATKAKTDAIKVAFLGGLAVAAVLTACGLAMALVRAVWQRPQLIRPNDSGLFPVVRGHAGREVFYHDLNRQLAGTTVYHVGPDGLEVQQCVPAGREAEPFGSAQDRQLQVTTQAQAVQLVAAASRGSSSAYTRRLAQHLATRSSRPAPHMPELQLLSPEIPEERLLLAAIRRDWEGEDDDGHLTGHQETL